MAYCLSRMSISAFFLGQYKESIDFAQQGYDISVSLGHSWGICTSLCRLGFAYLGLQQTLPAQEKFTESILLSIKVKMIPLTLYALLGLACIFIIEGQDQIGQALYNYARQHPKTPQAFLQQANFWIKDSMISYLNPFEEDTSLDDIVELALSHITTVNP